MIIIKDIPSLKAHLAQGRFNHNDILPFLSVMRNELENRSLQEQMKWLNLFCNWSFHSKITSSMITVDIMQSFLSGMVEWDMGDFSSFRRFNDTIINGFKSDLIQLLQLVDINHQFIENDETFVYIFNYVLFVIHKRPLMLPTDRMINQREARRLRIETLKNTVTSIFKTGSQIESLELKTNQQNQLSWLLKTTAFIDIEIPIGYGTKRFTLNAK